MLDHITSLFKILRSFPSHSKEKTKSSQCPTGSIDNLPPLWSPFFCALPCLRCSSHSGAFFHIQLWSSKAMIMPILKMKKKKLEPQEVPWPRSTSSSRVRIWSISLQDMLPKYTMQFHINLYSSKIGTTKLEFYFWQRWDFMSVAKCCWDKWIYICKKMRLDSFLFSYTKFNFS